VLAEFTRNDGDYAESLRQLAGLGDQIDGIVPADFLSISIAVHLDHIGLPEFPGLPDLGDVIGNVIGNVLDDVLDDVLGDALPRPRSRPGGAR
jgi:hypothetical protein